MSFTAPDLLTGGGLPAPFYTIRPVAGMSRCKTIPPSRSSSRFNARNRDEPINARYALFTASLLRLELILYPWHNWMNVMILRFTGEWQVRRFVCRSLCAHALRILSSVIARKTAGPYRYSHARNSDRQSYYYTVPSFDMPTSEAMYEQFRVGVFRRLGKCRPTELRAPGATV